MRGHLVMPGRMPVGEVRRSLRHREACLVMRRFLDLADKRHGEVGAADRGVAVGVGDGVFVAEAVAVRVRCRSDDHVGDEAIPEPASTQPAMAWDANAWWTSPPATNSTACVSAETFPAVIASLGGPSDAPTVATATIQSFQRVTSWRALPRRQRTRPPRPTRVIPRLPTRQRRGRLRPTALSRRPGSVIGLGRGRTPTSLPRCRPPRV